MQLPFTEPPDSAAPRCTQRSESATGLPSGVRYSARCCPSTVTRMGFTVTRSANSTAYQKFFSILNSDG